MLIFMSSIMIKKKKEKANLSTKKSPFSTFGTHHPGHLFKHLCSSNIQTFKIGEVVLFGGKDYMKYPTCLPIYFLFSNPPTL